MTTPNTAMPASIDSPAGYDPLNPTPYKPPQDVSTPPPITAPPPKVSEEGSAPPKAPTSIGKGGTGTATSIAFIADSILRGVMRGRQDAQVAQAAKLDKLSKGLQFSYQNAAQKYVELVKSGADPKSKEVVEAGMAADAAWQSMMGLYGNYIMGEGKKDKKGGGGGKGKSKGGDPGQPEDPTALLASQDPQEKIRGWFMISQKAGPPYKYQAAQFMTPEYRKERELQRGSQQMEGDIQEKRLKLHELQKIEPAKLNEQQKSEMERLRTDPELFPEMAKRPTKIAEYIDEKGFKHIKFRNPDGSTYEEMADEKSRALATDNGKRAWKKDEKGKITSVLVDPKTNQIIPGSENADIMPPANMMDLIRTSEFTMIDGDGGLHRVPTTTVTTHVPHGGAPGASGAPASSGAASAAPHAGAGAGAGAGTGAGAGAADPSAPHIPGRYIGDTGRGQGARSIRKQAEKVQPLANLLSVQQQYMDDIKKDPSKANPRSDLALVIAAVRSMNPGSVRLPNKELELELKAGSFGQRFSRWYSVATDGTIPNDQREQLFKIVHDETSMAGENLVKDWHTKIPNEPLPSFLQQFDKSGGAGAGAGAGGNQPLTPEQEQVLDKYFPKKP